ncbi:MAG: GTP-binding protein [Ktedonobacterales bacterium]|nr:GTP-binding protein [Ktedonobacterales bacterium]
MPKFGGRSRNLLKFSTIASIPSNLAQLRKALNSINWQVAQEEIAEELQHKVAILGLANSGKSTLFNTLQGKYRSAVSATAGTTTTLVRGDFGPFALIDTPGHLPDLQAQAVAEAAVVVYLLDAAEGLRPRDSELIEQLRKREKPLVVALNKADLLAGSADEAAARTAARLHLQDVIPIAARTGENVAEELIPALIETSPEAAVVLGRQLPQFRREAASKLTRTAMLVSLAAGLEPIPLIDIPILLSTQIRLVLRIAAVYGEPLKAEHARELMLTIAGGLALRYLAEEVAKAVPFGGDLVSGAIAAAGTWAIGQVAMEYFESGKQLNRRQISDLFSRSYRRYREEHPARALMAPAEERPVLPAGE